MKLVKAIENLRPGSKWILHGSLFENIEWLDDTTQPTLEEIDIEINRITTEEATNQYKTLRVAEYPPMADYLDGVVKGDQAQIDAYIAACQAVKNKYPKPE